MDSTQRHHLEKYSYRTPPKRYSILFQRFYITPGNKILNIVEDNISDQDNYNEELRLIKEIYDGTEPEYVEVSENVSVLNRKSWLYENEKQTSRVKIEYSYLVLDYRDSQIVKEYNFPGMTDKKDKLMLKDILFRKKDEVPENYKWDGVEEYQGWLRFRWGDGRNAVNQNQTPKPKPKKQEEIKEAEEETWIDDLEEKYDIQKMKALEKLKQERW